MTVLALNTSSGPFIGNGATTVFPFTFSAGSSAEVEVQVNGAVVTSGFTITLSANQSTTPGGSITFTAPPVNSASIVIASNPNFQQLISFKDSGPFLQSTLDIALDRAARPLLWLRDRLLRAIIVPVGTAVPSYAAFLASVKGDPGGNTSDIGLLTQAPFLNIPTGVDSVATSGADALGHGRANYIAGTAPTSRSGFTSSNARNFVLSKEQTINPRMFYDATDPDFQNAMQKSFDYLAAIGRAGNGYLDKVAGGLYVPNDRYLLHDELSLPCAIDINGESTVMGGGSVFEWTASSGHGFKIGGWDGVSHHGTGSKIRGLTLKGWYAGPSDRAAKHAIYVNGQATIEKVFGGDFPGRLVYAFADVGASNGNANLSIFRDIYGENCDLVLMLQGGDANACVVEGIRGQSNRLGVYWDWSFLGNAAFNLHAENCGLDPNFRSRCEKSGHIYVVAYGQEAWCSTNSPTGTATSNQGWLYLNDGPTNFYTATWVTGQTWYFTTPVSVGAPDNGNTLGRIEGAYIEGGMNPIVLGQNASCTTTTVAVIWQQSGARHGGTMRGNAQYMLFGNSVAWPGNTDAEGALHNFGPVSGAADDVTYNLNSTRNIFVNFNRYATDGTLIATDGNIVSSLGEVSIKAVSTIHFYFNGTDVATTASTGLNLPTGKVLSVNSVQVVGARKTGWAVDTGTAKRTANATYSGTAEVGYTQATVQALMDAVRDLSQTVKALKDDLHGTAGHGLIGT